MGIGDRQLDAAQAAPGRLRRNSVQNGLGLAVTDGHPKHFAPAVGIDGHSRGL